MKYKTIIEVITEADDPQDAADVAGDYLRGFIDSGVQMKCQTKPATNRMHIACFVPLVLLTCLFTSLFLLKSDSVKKEGITISPVRNVSAIQPPLRSEVHPDEKQDQ